MTTQKRGARPPVNRIGRKDNEKKFLLTWELYQWVLNRSKALDMTHNAYARAVFEADMEHCSRSPEGIKAPIVWTRPIEESAPSERTIDKES